MPDRSARRSPRPPRRVRAQPRDTLPRTPRTRGPDPPGHRAHGLPIHDRAQHRRPCRAEAAGTAPPRPRTTRSRSPTNPARRSPAGGLPRLGPDAGSGPGRRAVRRTGHAVRPVAIGAERPGCREWPARRAATRTTCPQQPYRTGAPAREEHRREPEPDPRPARRRGALRRPQAQPGQGVPRDRAAGPGAGLPSGQGAEPHHRPAGRPRLGAAGGRQRGAPARSTARPPASTSCSVSRPARDHRHHRRSTRSSTEPRGTSPPRSTSVRRSRCRSSRASRCRSRTPRSPTRTSTSSWTSCATASAR